MCICGKVEYVSKTEAWSAKRKMDKKYNNCTAYKCNICNNYHLGRKVK